MTISGEWLTTAAPALHEPAAARAGVSHRLEIRSLLHPHEASRFRLALVSSGVVLGGAVLVVLVGGGIGALFGVALTVLIGAATIWTTMQLLRARLLGRAVRVT